MHVKKRRTNGDHVQVGILLRESTALHTGVYRLHDHIRAGQMLVGLVSDMGQLAVGIDRPAGNMTLAVEGKAEAIGQCAADHTDLSGLIGNAAAGKHCEAHHILVHGHHTQVGGALHQPVNERTHGMYVIGNRGHQPYHTITNLPCQYAVRRGITEGGGEHHIRFDVAESLCELCAEGFNDSLGPVLLGGRQNNGGGAKCGDGVLRLTAAEGGHAVADAALSQHSQQCSDADQRVGVTLVDPHAGVTAQQTTEGNGQCLAAHNRLFPLGLVAVVKEVAAGTGIAQ